MPMYDYRCDCGKMQTEYRTIENRHNAPLCSCGKQSQRVISAPMVAPDIQPYKAMAGDQRWIKSRAEHREFLKENNLIEVGNG